MLHRLLQCHVMKLVYDVQQGMLLNISKQSNAKPFQRRSKKKNQIVTHIPQLAIITYQTNCIIDDRPHIINGLHTLKHNQQQYHRKEKIHSPNTRNENGNKEIGYCSVNDSICSDIQQHTNRHTKH